MNNTPKQFRLSRSWERIIIISLVILFIISQVDLAEDRLRAKEKVENLALLSDE